MTKKPGFTGKRGGIKSILSLISGCLETLYERG